MTSRLVTIIIPFQNHKLSIVRTLNSLLGQTHSNIIIKVIDNKSSDGSLNLVENLVSKNASQIILIRNENQLTEIDILKQSLSLADGDYTGFFSPTTFYPPTLIQDQLTAFDIYKDLGAVATLGKTLDENNKLIQIKSSPSSLLKRNISFFDKTKLFSFVLEFGDFLYHQSVLIQTPYCKSLKTEDLRAEYEDSYSYKLWLQISSFSQFGIISSISIVDHIQSTDLSHCLSIVRTSKSPIFKFLEDELLYDKTITLSSLDLGNYEFLSFTNLVQRIDSMIYLKQWNTIPDLNPFHLRIFLQSLKRIDRIKIYLQSLLLYTTIALRENGLFLYLFFQKKFFPSKDPLYKNNSYLTSKKLPGKKAEDQDSDLKNLPIRKSQYLEVSQLETLALNSSKIILVAREMTGGLARHIEDILESFSTSPKDVVLITNLLKVDRRFRIFLSKFPEFRSQIIDLPISPLPGFSDLIAIKRLFYLFKSTKARVIHGHGAKGGLYSRLLGHRFKIKSIYTPHGGSLHSVYHPLVWKVYTWVERWLFNYTDLIIFESDYSRKQFDKFVCPSKGKSIVNLNGISLNSDSSLGLISNNNQGPLKQSPHGPWVLGAFGTLRKLKGHDLLIIALRILRDRGYDVQLKIFGQGEERENLQELIVKLGLSSYAFLEGETSQPLEKMKECDILIQPSRFESLCYAPLEAMSVGVPVIASSVGGLKEIIENNKTGLLVNKFSPREFADKIEILINDSDLRSLLIQNALSSLKEKFSKERMIEQLKNIYSEIPKEI